MQNKQQENCLNNAQNELQKVRQLAEQLKNKTEFSAELANINNLQQTVQRAEQEIQNAKNQE